jgi:hypothetical protein
MHMGMRMNFVGGGMRKTVRGGGMRMTEYGMTTRNWNELCWERE